MIEDISIKNFQSHPDSFLRLSKGVNIIKGTSDVGKSAILRSLYWVIEGIPMGDAFRSDWGGDTEVRITVDGNTVGRKRNNADNIYFLNEEKFKAFKTNIPDEIKAVLNISEKINIQKQMDTPFLLSQSSGEKARQLNELVDLQIVDASLQYIEKKKRKLKTDQKYLEQNREELKAYLLELKDLDVWEKAVQELNEEWERVFEEENKLALLRVLIKDIRYKKEKIEEIKKVSGHQSKIEVLEKNINFLSIESDSLQRKRNIIEKLQETKKIYLRKRKELTEYRKELKEIMPPICPLCGAVTGEKECVNE